MTTDRTIRCPESVSARLTPRMERRWCSGTQRERLAPATAIPRCRPRREVALVRIEPAEDGGIALAADAVRVVPDGLQRQHRHDVVTARPASIITCARRR